MIMRQQKYIRMLLLLTLLCSIMGCGAEKPKVEEKTKNETCQDAKVQESDEMREEREEKSVDFPFGWGEEDYSLTLSLKGETGEYELRLYDENKEILQQISCGKLKEPIEFSYDGLIGWHDLEIFPADSPVGLYFRRDGEKFSEEAIEIPRYEEVLWPSAMLVIEDEDTRQVKRIYQINEEQRYTEEIRRWTLQKDMGELEIWDDLDGQSLFEGIVTLNDEGILTNQEYYDMLFLDDLYVRLAYPEEMVIPVWIDEPRTESTEDSLEIEPFENVRAAIFGDNGHTGEYKSRETLLSDFGVKNCEPMYQYYDRHQNLRLELYKDEGTEAFCGIVYEYSFDNNQEKWASMYGFTISSAKKRKWTKEDIFFTGSVYGDDVTKYVDNPEEIKEYTPDGNLDYYCCKGMTEREVDGEMAYVLSPVLKINYIYRDDGTLFYKSYWHDPLFFSTTLSSLESYYDEKGRILYESGYITHGELEYYYIYKDQGEKPAYCLCLDYAGGYAIPDFVQYD